MIKLIGLSVIFIALTGCAMPQVNPNPQFDPALTRQLLQMGQPYTLGAPPAPSMNRAVNCYAWGNGQITCR